MKTLIIYMSVHHGNTEKIARKIGEVLNAELKKPYEVKPEELANYDLIGFGSGIYMFKHHKTLLNFIDNMPDMAKKPVFIFSTSGASGGKKYHKELRDKLIKKNCNILDEFNCLGWDSFGPLKMIGGINKNKPDDDNFKEAGEFAEKLLK